MGVASLVLGILAVLIGIFSSGVLGWLGAIMAKTSTRLMTFFTFFPIYSNPLK